MLKFFVKRPVTTIMFVMFWVALGIASFPGMNVERMPAVDLPMVSATFIYPGASSLDIESLIVRRAEDAVSEIAGLKRLTSQIFENGAFVMAEFNIGVNVNDKASEFKAQIDKLADEFPADMRNPVVEKLNPLSEPVMDIAISGADTREIELFVKNVLSQQITALPGVASVSVFGGRERAVRIQLSPEVMAAHGVNIMDVVRTLSTSNLNVPGGRIERGIDSNLVRFAGEFSSVSDISNLRMSTAEGDSFKLSEIAEITDTTRDVETGARFNGEEVVIVSVVKASDGNAVRISQDVRRNFNRFEGLMNEYFEGSGADVSMHVIFDSSTTISKDTNSTLQSIILGIILTALTLLAFTKNWRTTVIASVVIPASLVSGFFFIDMSGFSINSMTLLAMATALGTLIAGAIILIESALAQLNAGASPEDAAINGTKKAMIPIMAAVGTNLVVFMPLAFMGGIAGEFMQDFGLTVVYLTVLSLMFSVTLTPMMIASILKKVSNRKKAKKGAVSQLLWFKKFFDYQIARPWRVIAVAMVTLVSSMFLMPWIGQEFQPSTDVNEISITARAPMGTTYSHSEQIASEIESRLAQFREVESTSVKIGERGMQNISIKVGLVPRGKRVSDKRLMQRILPKISDIPGVEIQMSVGERRGGIMNDLTMNIIGLDDTKREAYARDIIRMVNNIPEIQSAVLLAQAPGDELKFVPDAEKMQFWGVSNQTAAMALRTALFGNDSLRYKEDGNEFPIIVEFYNEYKTRAMFGLVFVQTPKGLVALSELGTIESSRAMPDITRVDKARVTEIGINLGKSTIGPVQEKIEAELARMEFAPGYAVQFGMMSDMQDEANAEMLSAFLLAAILTYMLLAAIMNSWIHPFVIAMSILFSFSGVFVMLFLTGASVNIAALLALVMLVGLTTNNNILVLEPMMARTAKGEDAKSALWSEYVDKSRMLLMLTIAVAAGMTPQLWSGDGIKTSMGSVIIGGMVASLFWTFAVTPAMFTAAERIRRKKISMKNLNWAKIACYFPNARRHR